MTTRWLILCLLFILLGCSTSSEKAEAFFIPPIDDRGIDQGAILDMTLTDIALEDMAIPPNQGNDVDAEVPMPGTFCDGCSSDDDCESGSLCLTNQNTNEQFCGAPCSTGADCPRGASCFDISDTEKQCAPFGGTCTGFPPSDLGGACTDDTNCQNGASLCQTVGDRSFCTIECASNTDCPAGMQQCISGTCLADWTTGPEGCGRVDNGPISNCGANGECPSGQSCLTAVIADYPARLGPLCGLSCNEAVPCPDGSRCAHVGADQTYCIPAPCECLARPHEETVLDNTLGLAGLHRCDVGIADEVLHRFEWNMAQDPYRLPFFNRIYQDAYGGYRWARDWRASVAAQRSQAGAVGVIRLGMRTLGMSSEMHPESEDESRTPLSALTALHDAGGAGFDEANAAEILAQLPAPLTQAVTALLYAQLHVIETRRALDAEAGLSDTFLDTLYPHLLSALSTRPDFIGLNLTNRDMKRLTIDGYHYGRLIDAGARLAEVIESIDWQMIVGLNLDTIRIETPYGPLVIHGNGDDELSEGGTPLLLIDTGGHDRYLIPTGVTSSPFNPVSVAIDLGGNDIYGFPGGENDGRYPPLAPADSGGRYDGSHPQVGDAIGPMSMSDIPRQGAGILGVGILYDRSGDDIYLSHKLSQGIGIFGMGLLIDKSGEDRYTCEQGCQGAGAFGMGLLLDGGGSDRYIGVQYTQGYGYIRGLGLLHDLEGDDHYEAVLGDPEFGGVVRIYPSAQNDKSNASFSQGAGFGRRVANSSAVFASGGLGSLIDEGSGDDVYRADIFAQATGYWFGTGILTDGGGNDTYQGRWYVQGSTAHYALSYFFEEGGDDLYNPMNVVMATAVGQGHDLSHGWLVDYEGNDEYFGPGLGMGGGNDNGIGFFIEVTGDDTYHAPDSTTYGGANIGDRGDTFDSTLCLGIFIDGGGTDTYDITDTPSVPANDMSWRWQDRRDTSRTGALGAGTDTDNANVIRP